MLFINEQLVHIVKKVIVSVTSDLTSDKRVHRTCMTLVKMGFDVLLVGREKRNSLPLTKRLYEVKRMSLFFEKGFLFYATFQIRLFFFILFHKADLLVSNDLDTLLPNYLIKKFKKPHLVYDAHEYFTGVPELVERPFVQKVWKRIERWILPNLNDLITVNNSIAHLYENEYHKEFTVVRNIPEKVIIEYKKTKKELGLNENKNIIILQGSGINIDRGAEEAVLAMKWVEDAVLYIIGEGDVLGVLKEMVVTNKLSEKVIFIPKQPMDELIQYTRHADIGLSLDKDTNINYRYSLPNKLFDYIHAGVPVLASPLLEVKNIIQQYKVGEIIDNHKPEHIAEKINTFFVDKNRMHVLKENCIIASKKLNWEIEEKKLVDVFKRYI